MNYIEFANKFFHYKSDNGKMLYCARYRNSNGFALAVVASATFGQDGEMIDWAAYWGGCDLTQREQDAVRWVAAKGSKLLVEDARHFFGCDLPMEYYRA